MKCSIWHIKKNAVWLLKFIILEWKWLELVTVSLRQTQHSCHTSGKAHLMDSPSSTTGRHLCQTHGGKFLLILVPLMKIDLAKKLALKLQSIPSHPLGIKTCHIKGRINCLSMLLKIFIKWNDSSGVFGNTINQGE